MDLTSKLSLYDVLTQLISGFLIIAMFIPQTTSLQENFVVIIIFSYLIGIIYHRLLEWIRKGDPNKYSRCYEKCKKDIYTCICKLWQIVIKDWIFTIFRRNYIGAIIKANKKIYNVNESCSIEINKDEINADTEIYYKTYYSIMDKPAYNTIMFLEAQEAFLRNITWVVLFYLCCVIFSWLENGLAMKIMLEINYAWILLLIILILILFARYHTQMGVYKAVWGAGKYYKY